VRIARRFDECAVAAPEQGSGDEGDRVLRADRDHDLFRLGWQPARGVAIGDRRPQHRQSDRIKAGVAEVGRQRGGRPLCRVGECRYRRKRRLAEVEITGVCVLDRDRGARGEARDAPRPAHAVEVASIPQFAVGGRDRGAADPELRGEVALRRHAGAERDAAVQDEEPDAARESAVGRCSRGLPPSAHQ
jgi:hypothetical protein